jgi:putative ABC transport system permease protein
VRLALRLFWRDWRSGELGVLLLAVVLAVAIVTTLGLFVDRMQRAVEIRSATFLAGDLVLRATREVPEEWLGLARAEGLRTAQVLRFASMVFAGDNMKLASVKAVSSNYPLLGRVTISDATGAPPREVSHGPPPGEIWADARLLPALGLTVGHRLGLGTTELVLAAVLHQEPDGGGSLVALGPRVTMNIADIPASGVIQPGSRVQYSYLFAGEPAALARWRARIEPLITEGQKFISVEEGQPQVARSIERARSFLLLAGSLGVVLAGVALAMATRRYTERHADYVAILKTLGASAAMIRSLYAGNLALLAMLGILLGWTLGWLVQALAFMAVREIFALDVPGSVGMKSLWLGVGTGALCLLGLATPPLLRMAGSSPLRVLRRDAQDSGAGRGVYASGLLAFALLLYWYSGDLQLSLLVLGCLLLASLVVGGLSYGLLRRARLPGVQAQSALRLAFAALQRHAALNAVQILVFSLCLMLLLIMVLVRTALLDEWQRELPPRTPNHFLVNIAPYQVEGLKAFLSEHGLVHAGLYPMVPGRVLTINGAPARVLDGEELNIDREFNLTWSDTLPEDNRLVQGRWWGRDGRDEVSAEQGVARALGLKLGDRIGIQIGADRFEATLSSIRQLDWDSMRPNFFLMFPRQVLQQRAGMWLTSFYLEPGRKELLNELVREYPTISVLEMDALLAQLRGIIRQLSLAVEFVLLLLFVSGALVMIASVQAGLDGRFQESAILRALGAGRRLVLGSLIIEFALLGLFAGLLATMGAELAGWYIQTRIMDMDFRLHPLLWLSGPVCGATVAALLGLMSCRRVVNTPPITVLRDLG